MSKSKEPNLFEDAFDSAMEEVIPEEERIRYLASLGNFAHRNPIKEDLWNAMADLTIQGAALYTLGIDPDAICDETSHEDGVYVSSDALPKGYEERLRIIKSAVRADLIKRIVAPGNTPAEIGDHTQILKTSFFEWCDKNPNSCTHAEAIPKYPKYCDKVNREAEQAEPKPEESTHDPLPTDGIAAMFRLEAVDSKNVERWRSFAKEAKRNGLAGARMPEIGGKAQSRFDPVKVGEWLVKTGKFSREKVDRLLLNNLPPRNAHLKDLAAQ